VELVEDDGLSVPQLDELDGALTGCAVAIAEVGAFVLDGGEGQGRRALTLVPDLHICVVREDQVVGLVPEAVARLERSVRAGRPLTFVAGPSATSDIELDRVEGVHGPRVLHVVVAAP
jgi:L-lactate dehydrogenase complex protein LldG